jgi:hypothetical protein
MSKDHSFIAQIAHSSSLFAAVFVLHHPTSLLLWSAGCVPKCCMAVKKRSRFLTTAEAGEFLRLKKHTLENMRSQETGPPHRKHGGRVFYHLDDLIAWSKNTRRKK